MRHAPIPRIIALLGLASVFGSAGCVHHHYYGNAAGVPCEPAVGGASVVRYGEVCEVPQGSAGSSLAQNSTRARPVVTDAGEPARTLVSQPAGRPRRSSGLAWRRSDPVDNFARTKVDGAYEDESLLR